MSRQTPANYDKPVLHAGAGALVAPEFTLRKVLLHGLMQLRADAERLEELFRRPDRDRLAQNSVAAWQDEHHAAFIDWIDHHLDIGIGWPIDGRPLPFVGIATDTGGEDGGGSVLGDTIQVVDRRPNQDDTVDPGETESRKDLSGTVRRRVLGTGWSSKFQITSWARAPEFASIMHSAIRLVLVTDKGRLLDALGGVRLSLSESSFQPTPNLHPSVSYVPVLSASLDWTLRGTRREGIKPSRVTALPGRFT